MATASVGGAKREYRAEKLLVATGRRPNTDNIAIEQSGVSVDRRGEVLVDEFCIRRQIRGLAGKRPFRVHDHALSQRVQLNAQVVSDHSVLAGVRLLSHGLLSHVNGAAGRRSSQRGATVGGAKAAWPATARGGADWIADAAGHGIPGRGTAHPGRPAMTATMVNSHGFTSPPGKDFFLFTWHLL